MGRHREFDTGKALDAALSEFWQKGFEGTSYDDLTRATGVARPGLYKAFGNKEALFIKALDRYDERYMTFMEDALNEPTAKAAVQRVLAGTVGVVTLKKSSRGCLGVNGALACSDEAEPIRKELVGRRGATEAALRKRLDRARQEGDLPADADCAMLASFVSTVNQGLAVQAKAGASKKILQAIVQHVLQTWPEGPGPKAPARRGAAPAAERGEARNS